MPLLSLIIFLLLQVFPPSIVPPSPHRPPFPCIYPHNPSKHSSIFPYCINIPPSFLFHVCVFIPPLLSLPHPPLCPLFTPLSLSFSILLCIPSQTFLHPSWCVHPSPLHLPWHPSIIPTKYSSFIPPFPPVRIPLVSCHPSTYPSTFSIPPFSRVHLFMIILQLLLVLLQVVPQNIKPKKKDEQKEKIPEQSNVPYKHIHYRSCIYWKSLLW